jgi:hypothetical protein
MTADENRRFAALCYALGWTRGQLDSVLDGTADLQRVREVLNASSVTEIAAAMGMTAAELQLPEDSNTYLTDAEKWALSGRERAS